MHAVVHIALKDLRQRLRDRSAVLIAVVLPLVLAFIESLVFGSAAAPRPFRYAVADLDHGPIAQAFTTGVLRELTGEGVVTVRPASDLAEATMLAQRGTVDAAFVVPAGFSAAVTAAGPARLEVIGHADSPQRYRRRPRDRAVVHRQPHHRPRGHRRQRAARAADRSGPGGRTGAAGRRAGRAAGPARRVGRAQTAGHEDLRGRRHGRVLPVLHRPIWSVVPDHRTQRRDPQPAARRADPAGGGGVRAVLPSVPAMLVFATVAGGVATLRLKATVRS